MAGFAGFAAGANAAFINIVGNWGPLAVALGRSLIALKRWSSLALIAMGPLAKIGFFAAIAAGFTLISVAILKFTAGAVSAFGEAEAAYAKFNAELIGGGNAAGFTGKQYKALARALEETTTQSEVSGIKIATSLLKANLNAGQFQRSMELAADLAAAWGIEGADAGNRLAIVLTNVDVGIRKLRNKFVFTREQDQRLRNAVTDFEKIEIVLDALGKRFGGVAEALAGTVVGRALQLRVASFRALMEIGQQLAPMFAALINLLTQLVPLVSVFTRLMLNWLSPLLDSVTAIANVAASLSSFSGRLSEATKKMPPFFTNLTLIMLAVKALASQLFILGRILDEVFDLLIAGANLDAGGIARAMRNLSPVELGKEWIRFVQDLEAAQAAARKGRDEGLTPPNVPGSSILGGGGLPGANLQGKFESLERTWKRISEGAFRKKDVAETIEDEAEKARDLIERCCEKELEKNESIIAWLARIAGAIAGLPGNFVTSTIPGMMAEGYFPKTGLSGMDRGLQSTDQIFGGGRK